MFKQSRRKIVAAIMSVLVLLFLGTLAVIYASSYFEVSANNYKMLERHAQLHILTGDMDGEKPKEPQHGGMVPFPEGDPGEESILRIHRPSGCLHFILWQ